MSDYFLFYTVTMIVLIIVQVIQLRKSSGRDVLSWFQFAIYCGTIIWYALCLTGLYAGWFFFITSIAFIVAFAAEFGNYVLKLKTGEKKERVFAFFAVCMAFLPVIISQAILANVIPSF